VLGDSGEDFAADQAVAFEQEQGLDEHLLGNAADPPCTVSDAAGRAVTSGLAVAEGAHVQPLPLVPPALTPRAPGHTKSLGPRPGLVPAARDSQAPSYRLTLRTMQL
jgi:hypothetical protein